MLKTNTSIIFALIILSLILITNQLQAEVDSVSSTEKRAESIESSFSRLKGSLEGATANSKELDSNAAEESSSDDGFWKLAGTMAKGLAICIGFFFIGLSVYKRLRPKAFLANNRVRVIERISISPKTNLILVEVDGCEKLITVGSDLVQELRPLGRDSLESFQELSLCQEDLKLSA